MISINRKKRDLIWERENRQERRGKEEEEEKREKVKGRRRELEKISINVRFKLRYA
jgi:hypothetical protein